MAFGIFIFSVSFCAEDSQSLLSDLGHMESDDCDEHRTDDAQVLKGEEKLGDDSQTQTERAVRSPSPALSEDSTPPKKAYVLKKWRRITRDVNKDFGTPLDASNRILKRGSPAPSHPMKGQQETDQGFSPPSNPIKDRQETKPNSEGSVGSFNVSKNLPFAVSLPVQGLDLGLDSEFSMGSAFSVGTDSENSEDRSSKSSTTASAPNFTCDPHNGLGSKLEKNPAKKMNTKSLGSSALHIQQGKCLSGTCKKPRGEISPIEKENSYSSVESPSRSSNFKPVVFMGTSNGKLYGCSINNDGEKTDDAHANEYCSGENQAGFPKVHVADSEDLLQHDQDAEVSPDAKESKSENHSSTVQDPLTDSILGLQSLQEVLEQELHKFGEINDSLYPDSININTLAASSSSLESEEPNVQNVLNLESKLEEAMATIALRDSKVAELETFIISFKFAKETSSGTFRLQDEQCREMEIELEALFKKKIESEIECLVITKAIQNWKITVGTQPVLLKEQEMLVREQVKMMNKLGEAETRQSMLIKKAEDLEKHRNDIWGVEESYKMQRGVCKVLVCFSVQLMLLILVLWLFVLQLSSSPEVAVPT